MIISITGTVLPELPCAHSWVCRQEQLGFSACITMKAYLTRALRAIYIGEN